MKILCAWCCREGRPAYLGEREPLDNSEPTHGVCADHKAQLLESLPSRSFPDTQVLIVVHRSNMALYERLKLSLAAMSHVKVIVDRRISEERRHVRTRRIREGTLSPLGDFTIVRFTPKAPLSAAPLELEQRTASLTPPGSG
jgi:hypothetical protein